jgi:hypothetical protein
MSLTAPNGCLTPAGLRALASAPPGEGPKELVAHVANCERCQTRLLATDSPRRGGRRRGGALRVAILAVVGLLAMLLAMLATSLVRGG